MKREDRIKKIELAFTTLNKSIVKGMYYDAINTLHKIYYKCTEINYQDGINRYYDVYIILLYYTQQWFLAIQFLKKLIPIYLKKKNYKDLSRQYIVFGDILTTLGDYKSSFFYLNKALSSNAKAKNRNEEMYSSIYVALSRNSLKQRNVNEALEFVNSGLKIYSGTININLLLEKGKILIIMGKSVEANDILNKVSSLIPKKSLNIKLNYNKLLINYQVAFFIVDHEKFLKLVNSNLKLAIEKSKNVLVEELLIVLKDYYYKIKNYELAFKYSNQIFENFENKKMHQIDVMNSQDINPLGINEKGDNDYEIYHKSELNIAAKYQLKFQSKLPQSGQLNIQTLFKASKTLSGDYIGTFTISEDCFLVILADVVGKGITASYISFMLNGIIKSIINNTDSFNLKSIINDINVILADSLENNGFVSLWAGIIDTKNNKLESINAGHLPTYLLKNDGKIISLTDGCTILGMFRDLPKVENELINFQKGDAIISYSDGVIEKTNSKGEPYEKFFIKLIERYAKNRSFSFIKYLENDLEDYEDTSQIQDDVSCLLIEYT